jgi:hypothetical protein
MAKKIHNAEIVPTAPLAIQKMQGELLEWKRRALDAEAQLIELQRVESAGNISEYHRNTEIRNYLAKMEKLNLVTPGGLRSQPVAEPDEDQELVNEAWLIYCQRHHGGAGRF